MHNVGLELGILILAAINASIAIKSLRTGVGAFGWPGNIKRREDRPGSGLSGIRCSPHGGYLLFTAAIYRSPLSGCCPALLMCLPPLLFGQTESFPV
jgi:hypothetical protein